MLKDKAQAQNIRRVTGLLSGEPVESSTVCTVQTFMEKFMSADELDDYVKVLRMSLHGITYAESFFHYVKEGLIITTPVLTREDRGGNKYAWLKFSNDVGTKVILNEAMLDFVSSYQNKKIKPDFDLYSLIEEMNRQKSKQD